MKEIEVIKRDNKFGEIYPIHGSKTCDYRHPKERSLSGQWCVWGYKDPQDRTQCEYFGGIVERIVKIKNEDVSKTFCKCKRI